jgi:serine protease Do
MESKLHNLKENIKHVNVRSGYAAVVILVILCGAIGAAGGVVAQTVYRDKNANNTVSVDYIPSSNAKLTSQSANSTIPTVVNNVAPAVVDITSTSTTYSFFGGPQTTEGSGTGMILTSNGYILTNNHVLPTDGSTINVELASGKQYTAKIIATNVKKDLALIKINASGLPTVTLGNSSQEQIGSEVIAIGNALGQFQGSVVHGIISGTGRSVQASDQGSGNSESLSNLFQTDADINPGDSGGPLVDIGTGTVIGMDTAVASDGQGIGFAIPINEAKTFVAPYVNFKKA